MKAALIITVMYLGWTTVAEANEAVLTVKITGIEGAKGLVMIGLEKSADAYNNGPLEKATFRGEIVKAEGTSVVVNFNGITAGTYAVKAFQDTNSNALLDKNFMGIPTENYGFSNNARGTFGPASFEEAMFEFNGDRKVIEIGLK